MTSMAAQLAASLPAPALPTLNTNDAPQANAGGVQVPQRMEGLIDAEGQKAIESVALGSLPLLKILKHSTDALPPTTHAAVQQDRNPPPTTALSSRPDALGLLLGLDLGGVLEIEDGFALPAGDLGLGANSYAHSLLSHLHDVHTPDSPVGVYLSTRNGGFVTRAALDLVAAVERHNGRSGPGARAVLLIHDAAKGASANDVSVRAYVLSDAVREAAKEGKWDSTTLSTKRITSANMLVPLPINISTPSILSAFYSTLTTPSASASTSSAAGAARTLSPAPTPLPPAFTPLLNPASTLTSLLSDTLDSLTLSSAENNNVAYLSRQIARERTRHEGLVREREEENVRRRKQGLAELPSLPAEMRGGTKDPNRLELLCLQGQLDGLGRTLGAEAGKGLVRCYL